MILLIGLIYIGLILFYQITDVVTEKMKTIELYVLVDNDTRITYTGTYKDCKRKLSKDVKLIKLEGIL